MGVVNNEIRIAGLEANTAGIMTSVRAIEATTAGLMTSVRNASAAAAAAQETASAAAGAVTTLSSTVGGLVTDETKYNSPIFKYIECDYETNKTGAELFDMILGALYDNAGADTDFINILQLQVSVRAVGGTEEFNIMNNAYSNVVTKRNVNPAGTQPFDALRIVGWDYTHNKQCYMERTRNGGRVWECANIANITTTSFSEYFIYLWYEIKKPYSVAAD